MVYKGHKHLAIASMKTPRTLVLAVFMSQFWPVWKGQAPKQGRQLIMYYSDRLKQELFSKVNTLITCQSKTEKKAPSERVNTWYTSTLNFSFCTCVSLAFIVYLNQHSVYVAKQNKTNYLVNLGCSQLVPSISQRQPKETPFLPIS